MFLFFSVSSAEAAGAPPVAGATQSFVYTMANPTGPNSILAFQRDPQTGGLSFVASYATGGTGLKQVVGTTQSSIVTNGAFLYAVNAGSNDISAFAISTDGSLHLLGSPVRSGGTSPGTLTLHGQLLYVGNEGTTQEPANYSGFTVGADGSLAPLEGSTVTLNVGDGITNVLFDDSGSHFVGVRLGGTAIDTFTVSSGGKLVSRSTLGPLPGPFGAIFNPVNKSELIATLAHLHGAGTFFLSGDNTLALVATAVDAPSKDPCWTAVTPDGSFLWTSNFQPSSLSLFSISAAGQIEFLSEHETATFGNTSSDIAMDASNRFIYQLLPFPTSDVHIHVMAITGNTSDGGLSDVATVSIPGEAFPMGLVIVDTH
ncbi:MAG TPA: beta-propeller fold lactonase family protein [Candidatus Saccharimonadales bacterium]|nr:beta-propeller fold lactonase family protein [Candidatus Saccharimonadales bacterium]